MLLLMGQCFLDINRDADSGKALKTETIYGVNIQL